MAALRSISRFPLNRHFIKLRSSTSCAKRTILSPAYACSSVWEARRHNPILKNLDMYDFIAEIQRQTQRGHTISAVDIDVLFNCVTDSDQLDEAIRLLYKFRHSAKAADILESTHSAFVRACLQYGSDVTLLRILDDPINYGIFLDSHDANLLMDHFLKNGNHRDAAKVASKIMLQEDFQRKSTCWLAALSCLKWIKEPQPGVGEKTEGDAEATKQDYDDDEIIMRVPYLRNPYYDDHFDIVEIPALIGKSLAWVSRSLPNKELSSNLMALGYGIKKDYKNLASVLKHLLEKRTKLYAEVERYIMSAKTVDVVTSEEKPAEPTEPPKEEAPSKEAEPDADLQEIKILIDQFRNGDLLIQEDLEESLLEELNKVLPEFESNDIKERTSILHHWNDRQQNKIENQVLRYLKNERIKEIEKDRQSMQEMEEYLNFFENRTKLELSVHPELLKQEEEKKKQLEAEQQQLPSDDKYVIPELKIKRETEKVEF